MATKQATQNPTLPDFSQALGFKSTNATNARDAYADLLQQDKSVYVPNVGVDTAAKDVTNLLSQVRTEEKLRQKLLAAAPPSLPQWSQVQNALPGYENLPYSEKKKLYDKYIEEVKTAFLKWNDLQPKSQRMEEIEVDELFRKYNPAPVRPERSWGDLGWDLFTAGRKAVVGTGSAASGFIDALTGEAHSSMSEWLDTVSKELNNEYSLYEKDNQKQVAFELQKLYQDPETSTVGKLLGEAGITLSNLSVAQAVELVGQMAPSVLVSMAGGAPAAVLLNAVLSGGDAANTAREIAQSLTPKQIKSTEKGRELWSKHKGNLKAIRDELSVDGMRIGTALGGVIGIAGAAAPGSLERSISAAMRGGGRGALASAATGSVIGGIEEALTGVAGRAAGNAQGGEANLLESAGSDFALGLLGEGIGAGAGVAVGRRFSRDTELNQQDPEQTVGQAIRSMTTASVDQLVSDKPVTEAANPAAIASAEQALRRLKEMQEAATATAVESVDTTTVPTSVQEAIDVSVTPTDVQESVDVSEGPISVQDTVNLASPSTTAQNVAYDDAALQPVQPITAAPITQPEAISQAETPIAAPEASVSETEVLQQPPVTPADSARVTELLIENEIDNLPAAVVNDILAGRTTPEVEAINPELRQAIQTRGANGVLGLTDAAWSTAVINGSGQAALTALTTDSSVGRAQQTLASGILDAYQKAGLSIPDIKPVNRLVNENGEPMSGQYDPITNTVSLARNRATAVDLTHEMLHGLTYRGIEALETRASEGDVQARNRLSLFHALINKVREATVRSSQDMDQVYATRNVHELVAELVNPEFLAVARSIPVGKLPTSLTYTLYSTGKTESGNPMAAMRALGLTQRSPLIRAVAKLIKSVADMIAPGNRLNKRSILDTLSKLAASVIPTELVQQQVAEITTTTEESARLPSATEISTEETAIVEPPMIVPDVSLPQELNKEFQYKGSKIAFESAIDHAAFGRLRSKKHADAYTDFIRQYTGMTDSQIDYLSDAVRLAVQETPPANGIITVESSFTPAPMPLYSRGRAAAAASDLMTGTTTDIESEAAKDLDIPSERDSYQTVLTNVRNGVAASPATISRGITQAMRAKDADALKSNLGKVFNILNEKFHDSMAPVRRWLDGIVDRDWSNETQRRADAVQNTMYAAPGRRNHFLQQAMNRGGTEFQEAASRAAKATGLSEETLIRNAGYWLTARYAPIANQRLIDRAVQQVSDAQAAAQADPTNGVLVKNLRKAIRDLKNRITAVNNPDIDAIHDIGLAGNMSNAQATAMRIAAERSIPVEHLEKIANAVYDVNAYRLALDIETGKTAPEVATRFLNRPDLLDKLKALRDAGDVTTYDQDALNALREEVAQDVRSEYVPMTGDPLQGLETDTFATGTFTPNISADRQMQGRQTMPDDGITASFAGLIKSTSFAGWRPFQRAIADLYNHMSADERSEAGFGRRTLRQDTVIPNGSIVYRSTNGKAWAFYVDTGLFDAIRKSNVEDAGTLLKYAQKPTKWFSYAATQLNPFFAPRNFFRDGWERSELIRSRALTNERGNPVNSNTVARNIWKLMFNPEVWKAAYRFATNQPMDGSAASRAIQQLSENGGLSTYGDTFSTNRAKFITDIAAQRKSGAKITRQLASMIDAYNRTFDIVSPLASYMAMRNANVSIQQSSAITLDLMNFRKSGTAMPIVKALFTFAQPAVTSGSNLLSSIVDTKTGRIRWRTTVPRLAAYALTLAAIQAASRAVAGDDEGGNKMKQLPAWVVNNTIPFPIGNGVVTIPLGFGLPRIANSMALSMLNVATKEQTVGEAVGSTVSGAIVPAISPIDPVLIDWSKRPAEAFMLTFAPTWLKPFVSVGVNRTAFDAPIINTAWEKSDQFRSEQFGTNVPDFYRDVARSMRQLTGVDFAPEQVRTLMRGYMLGAPGLLATSVVDNPFRAEQGKQTDSPFTSWAYRGYSDASIRTQFYGYLEEIQQLRRRASVGEDLSAKDEELLRLGAQWDKVDKDFRNRASKISNLKGASDETKAKKRAELRKQRDPYIIDFVRRFREASGKPTT